MVNTATEKFAQHPLQLPKLSGKYSAVDNTVIPEIVMCDSSKAFDMKY